MNPPSNPPAVVIDANVLIALCAREIDKYTVALAAVDDYVTRGFVAYAPGVIISEALFALCRKHGEGLLTDTEHQQAVQHLAVRMSGVLPPPNGDASLVLRAEQVRGAYGCSRSADGSYIALAEQLAQQGPTELLTFDADLPRQAAAAPAVIVRLPIPQPPSP